MRFERARVCLTSGLLFFCAACGGDAPAATPPATLACQQTDGRCVVCSWMEQGLTMSQRSSMLLLFAILTAGCGNPPRQGPPTQMPPTQMQVLESSASAWSALVMRDGPTYYYVRTAYSVFGWTSATTVQLAD